MRLETTLLRLLPQPWRFRIQSVSHENKAILRGMAWVVVFLLGAKIVAALKEMLVAYRYGASALVDGYLFTFNLANWPVSVFFSVASFIFIPVLVRLRTRSPEDGRQLQAEMLGLSLVLSIVLALLAWLLLPWIINSPWVGLNAQAREAALASVPWCAGVIALGMLASLYSTWLMSGRRHANTFLECLPALGIGLFLFLWPWDTGNPTLEPMLWGMFAGFVGQLGLLMVAHADAVRPAIALRSPHWQEIYRSFGIMLAAQVVMTSTGLVDQFLLARLPEGSIATFGYAQRVMALVLGLSATVIGRAMLPVLSAAGDARASWRLARRWAIRLFWLGWIGAGALALLSGVIVDLLFQRGAFDVEASRAVADTLMALGVQLPFYLAGIVLVQWVGAVRKPGWLFSAASVAALSKVLTGWWCLSYGTVGVAMATAIMYLVSTATIAMLVSSSSISD